MGVSKSLQRTTAGNAPVQELIQDGRAAELLVRRREDAAGESMTWSWRRAFFSTRISRIRADFFSCVLCVSWGTLPGAVTWPAVTVGCPRIGRRFLTGWTFFRARRWSQRREARWICRDVTGLPTPLAGLNRVCSLEHGHLRHPFSGREDSSRD